LRPIQPGDCIGLVAPGSPFDPDKFQSACTLLEAQGYRLRLGEHVHESQGYVAGPESERAGDLTAALMDPEVAAVLCIRGGYGSGCLLPWLGFGKLSGRMKPLIGYSDVTFLHLAFQARMGWTTFHGPNLMDLAETPQQAPLLLQALQGELDFVLELSASQVLSPGIASGKLLGGNLTCIAHLMGTPYFPDFDGAILFIEDCNEPLYRLDRCINQLKLGRVFDNLAGLALGRFKNCGESDEICRMVLHHLKPFRFPIVADLPLGHIVDNKLLPLGIPFSLNTYEYKLGPLVSPFSTVG
jgi:muramoyltetrapeptide carboxypeptidase